MGLHACYPGGRAADHRFGLCSAGAGNFSVYLIMQVMLLSIWPGFNLCLATRACLSGKRARVGAMAALILLEVPSLLLGIAGGVLAAGLAAVILGYLSVRLTEIYFTMLTLSFGMMIFSIVTRWRAVTGGDDGRPGSLELRWNFRSSRSI